MPEQTPSSTCTGVVPVPSSSAAQNAVALVPTSNSEFNIANICQAEALFSGAVFNNCMFNKNQHC